MVCGLSASLKSLCLVLCTPVAAALQDGRAETRLPLKVTGVCVCVCVSDHLSPGSSGDAHGAGVNPGLELCLAGPVHGATSWAAGDGHGALALGVLCGRTWDKG